MCSARSDGLRKTLRHLEFVENGVAGAAYGRRRDRVREVVFWCRDARIWQLRWSRRHAPPPGCLLGACGASGPARARRWRRRVDSAVPPCRRDPRRSAADAGRIWLAPTSYVCRRPLRSRWGRRASISRCCVTRGRLTEPAGRRRLAARPETLGGRRGEDLAGADKLRVSEAFAFALGAESIDLEMLRNSGTSDRARRPPATGGAIRPETPRRGRAGRQVRLGGYGRHHWAFSRSGAPMPPPRRLCAPGGARRPKGQ